MTKKEALEQSQNAIGELFNLIKYLYNDDAPYDMKDIPESSPYYEAAKDIAKEAGIDWENMTHAESNSIMVNLIGEYYYNLRPVDKYVPVLTISYKQSE